MDFRQAVRAEFYQNMGSRLGLFGAFFGTLWVSRKVRSKPKRGLFTVVFVELSAEMVIIDSDLLVEYDLMFVYKAGINFQHVLSFDSRAVNLARVLFTRL